MQVCPADLHPIAVNLKQFDAILSMNGWRDNAQLLTIASSVL